MLRSCAGDSAWLNTTYIAFSSAGGGGDLLHLAAAGVEARVGLAASALHHPVAQHAGALHQAHHFLDRLLVMRLAEVEADDDRRLGIGGCGGSF